MLPRDGKLNFKNKKKLLIVLPFLAIMACEKESLQQVAMQNSPSMKQVGEGDYGTSNFTSPTCQSTGSIDACCPTPALDCSRTEVVVTPSELGPINAVDNDDAGDVVDFFTNEDWMIYFPQLESETEVLTDIFNGLYTWNKRHYGDYVWVEFVAEDDDNFSLPLKIEE